MATCQYPLAKSIVENHCWLLKPQEKRRSIFCLFRHGRFDGCWSFAWTIWRNVGRCHFSWGGFCWSGTGRLGARFHNCFPVGQYVDHCSRMGPGWFGTNLVWLYWTVPGVTILADAIWKFISCFGRSSLALPSATAVDFTAGGSSQCAQEFIQRYHDSIFAGHLGVSRTVYRLLDRVYWPGLPEEKIELFPLPVPGTLGTCTTPPGVADANRVFPSVIGEHWPTRFSWAQAHPSSKGVEASTFRLPKNRKSSGTQDTLARLGPQVPPVSIPESGTLGLRLRSQQSRWFLSQRRRSPGPIRPLADMFSLFSSLLPSLLFCLSSLQPSLLFRRSPPPPPGHGHQL